MNYHKGDLLSVQHGIIVHGCNAQGVMGSGVAKAIKEKYPKCFALYKNHCAKFASKRVILGDCIWYDHKTDLIIVNAITQYNYGNDGNKYVSYDALDTVFQTISRLRKNMPVHFPKIGAGLGGGDWEVISAIINKYIPDGNCWVLE